MKQPTMTAPAAQLPLLPTRAPASSESPVLARFLAALDGLQQVSLQEIAYRLWCIPSSSPGHTDRVLAVANALIHLRRTNRGFYRIASHAAKNAAEPPPCPTMVRQARRAAFPIGYTVKITGEDTMGTVVYNTVRHEPLDLFPAPWYLVAAPHLHQCRAHGADEIEAILNFSSLIIPSETWETNEPQTFHLGVSHGSCSSGSRLIVMAVSLLVAGGCDGLVMAPE
ncbi:hypothetical protein, partial [Streptomyces sp. NPDC046161]|uniref:hypothetical protein n=1 Tax=Streptomyces sp. NPDC046161 TaxID=3155132 RepID=UPI0033E64942